MEYTRNSDLNHYKEFQASTNCGSYALRLNEWYHLNLLFEEEMGEWTYTWIRNKAEEGYTEYEISALYGRILARCMLAEFKGDLEICDGTPPETDDVELVALNTFCYCDDPECFESIDTDFHFKVFRDGVWKEKCGRQAVRECDGLFWGGYIGKPIYFYHKIK